MSSLLLPGESSESEKIHIHLDQRPIPMPTLLAIWLFCVAFSAAAAVLHVGAHEQIKTIAEAARLAKDGDVVLIASGNYVGDVAVWTQRHLTIQGLNPRPVLHAAGQSAEGKAIWVIRNGDFNISNIEFRGARVADGNGAGIRFEQGKLHLTNCVFVDNQMGILTGNQPDTELAIERSLFAQAPRQKSPLPHLLYAGRIARLSVVGSRFHDGYFGHLLKSRARTSDIRYNWLVDGDSGSASYEADFPNGGAVTLVGNVLGQSKTTENHTLLAYGAEGGVWPQNRLQLVHNTFYNAAVLPARFLHVFADKLPRPPTLMTSNNLLVGAGVFTMNLPGDHQENHFAPASRLGNLAPMDFTLRPDTWLRESGKLDQ